MCNLFFLGAYAGQEVQNPEGGHVRPRHDLPEAPLQPQWCAGGHQERRQVDQGRVGKNPVFKAQPSGFFLVSLGFFLGVVFFFSYTLFAQKREFLGFFQFQEYF
jgi:hypothetical protein